MNTFEKILYHLATKQFVPKVSLISLNKTFPQVYRGIKRGIEKGFIVERTITIVSNKKRYKEDYLYITASGLRYLSSLDYDELDWLNAVGKNVDFSSLIGKEGIHTQMMRRYLNIVSGAIAAEQAGAIVRPMFYNSISIEGIIAHYKDEPIQIEMDIEESYDEEYGDELTLTEDDIALFERDWDDYISSAGDDHRSFVVKSKDENNILPVIVGSAYGRYCKDKESKFSSGEDPCFYNCVDIKLMVTNLINSRGNGKRKWKDLSRIESEWTNKKVSEIARDIQNGKFVGLIDTKINSYLMYSVIRGEIDWTESDIRVAKSVLYSFIKNYSKNQSQDIGIHRAILTVPSAKVFSDIFYGKSKKVVGEGFTEFIVVPISNDGTNYLREFINNNGFIDIEKRLIETAISSEAFYPNKKTVNPKVFPLLDSEGIPMMIGIRFDLVKLEKVRRLMERYSDQEYGVICFEWQVDYYKKFSDTIKIVSVN